MNKTELELVMDYKSGDDRVKNKIFSYLVKKYQPFIKTQTNKIFRSINLNYFAYDWEDCESEVLYGIKLALDWFDVDKVSDKFNADSFSLAYYAELQISARIGTYKYKINKKEKRSVEATKSIDTQKISSEGSTYSDKYEDYSQNTEQSFLVKEFHQELDSKLTPVEKKIKDYLMEGLKESKIKSRLKLTENKLSKAKQQIGKVINGLDYTLS